MGQARPTRQHLYLVRNERERPAAGRADEQVQRALALMHADLAQRWTVRSLARRVGLSRAAFARRFVATTGESPARHLRRARMERAAGLLRDTRVGLAQVGALVGYDSEFAFNRAFKRLYHVAPGTFRRTLQTGVPTLSAASHRAPGCEERQQAMMRAEFPCSGRLFAGIAC